MTELTLYGSRAPLPHHLDGGLTVPVPVTCDVSQSYIGDIGWHHMYAYRVGLCSYDEVAEHVAAGGVRVIQERRVA